jgi:hypothetical protein
MKENDIISFDLITFILLHWVARELQIDLELDKLVH